MFRVTLKLPVETPNHPFTAPTTMKFIQPFLKIVSYQGLVDKVSAFYTKNLAQPWQMMFKIFNHCLTSRTSGIDQTKINILHIFHAVINRVHRLEEDYHSIKDDILLVSVYAIGNVIVKGMLILDDLPTNDIHETKEYKDYVKEFFGLDVPTIQPQLIESTQGENRTPRATMTPNPKDVQKKPSSTAIPPPSDDKERDDIAEATLLSLALHKTDSGTRLEPVSHKENPKIDNDDDDNDDHDDHALVRTRVMGSSNVRNEKIQTPILSLPRSSRTNLSLNKTISQESTANVSHTPATTSQDRSKSKHISNKYKHIPRSIKRICRHQGFMMKQMEKKYVTNREF
ncbi:hypothetical protein Tco_0927002 [Tanacetum coccineum]|uniref:Uncharacterized protein n=1 Tax=Tanacetum coccineum TaxID=301880 RepID=A0ABQ5DE55_9ASTR